MLIWLWMILFQKVKSKSEKVAAEEVEEEAAIAEEVIADQVVGILPVIEVVIAELLASVVVVVSTIEGIETCLTDGSTICLREVEEGEESPLVPETNSL